MTVSLRLPERRTLATGALVIVAVVAGVLAVKHFRSNDTNGESGSVPTVPITGTPTNIGCIDEAGSVTASMREWYSDDADGALVLSGEISSSLRLGDFSAAATDAVVAEIGRLATSAVRDLAPTLNECVTMRYAGFALEGGGEVEVMAWRIISATSPMWVPNEAAFTQFDETTLVSSGPHVVSTLSVGPDGTTVLASAFGTGAKQLLGAGPPVGTEPPEGTEPGPAPATADQLAAIGRAVLQQIEQR
ncbi:MAG: hypothetical protein WCC60_04555 [Ilumatobacteraceae bacterium]